MKRLRAAGIGYKMWLSPPWRVRGVWASPVVIMIAPERPRTLVRRKVEVVYRGRVLMLSECIEQAPGTRLNVATDPRMEASQPSQRSHERIAFILERRQQFFSVSHPTITVDEHKGMSIRAVMSAIGMKWRRTNVALTDVRVLIHLIMPLIDAH